MTPAIVVDAADQQVEVFYYLGKQTLVCIPEGSNVSALWKVRFLLPRQHRQAGPLWPRSRCAEGGSGAAP